MPQGFISPFQVHSLDEIIPQTYHNEHPEEHPEIGLGDFDPFPQWLISPDQPSVDGNRTTPTPEALIVLLLSDIKAARLIASCWSAITMHPTPHPFDLPGATPKDGEHNPKATNQLSGTPPTCPSVMGHAYYRGLWWGAENVTVGDLLRLSFSESRFTYTDGASTCFTDELRAESDGNNATGGSEAKSGRCMFLGLRTLIVIHERSGKTLHAVGQLYKLMRVSSSTGSKPVAIHCETKLPQPPEGYVFCRMLANGWEVQLPLSLVRGRYYPRLQSNLGDATGFDADLLGAMEGLTTRRSITPRYNVTGSREETVGRAKGQAF
jgi:hypothetical protein